MIRSTEEKQQTVKEIARELGEKLHSGEITEEEYDRLFEERVASTPEFREEVSAEARGVMGFTDSSAEGAVNQDKRFDVEGEEVHTSDVVLPKPITIPGSNNVLSQSFVNDTLKSFRINNMGDYEQVQTCVFDTLLREGFFNDVNTRSRTDVNYDSGIIIETNKSGIDESFCLENYGRIGRFKK